MWSSYASLGHWVVTLYVNSNISRSFKVEIRIINVYLCIYNYRIEICYAILRHMWLSLRWLNYSPSLSWQGELDRVSIIFCILLIQLLHGLCTTFPHSSYDLSCDYDTFLHFLYVVSLKEKKKKRNINNDLAVLPSHDKALPSVIKIRVKKAMCIV